VRDHESDSQLKFFPTTRGDYVVVLHDGVERRATAVSIEEGKAAASRWIHEETPFVIYSPFGMVIGSGTLAPSEAGAPTPPLLREH